MLSKIGINTDADKLELSVAEAEAYNVDIIVNLQGISPLIGIEAFVNITKLLCYSNPLTGLDISKNTALTALNCYENNLTILDVRKNTALTIIHCALNQLVSLNISNNTNLSNLYCFNNPNVTCNQFIDYQVKTGWQKDPTVTYSETCTTGIANNAITPAKTKTYKVKR